VYGGVQWVFGVFLLGRPLDRGVEHTLGFDLPRIDEWMDELHGLVYSSKTDLRLGYHQVRDKKKDTHRIAFESYYELLVIPMGMTNTPDTVQSCMQLWRILLLLFDTLITYNRTWEDHLWQLDESWAIMDMTEICHLDHVIGRRSKFYRIGSQSFQQALRAVDF